jgi:hypothetical protein
VPTRKLPDWLVRIVGLFDSEKRKSGEGAWMVISAHRRNSFYFGVYVRSVSRLTPVYMALIDPFRKLIVYPSLLRSVRASWNQTFGTP